MRKNPRKLLNESLAWIRENPRATTADVPQYFIELWSWSDQPEEKPSGWHLCVFGFGFMQHELMTSDRPPEEERSVSLHELLERFWQWQMKLGLAEVNQRTEVAIQALPLWAFPEEEQVIWSRRPQTISQQT